MGAFRHFSDIRAWREARLLATNVYALSRDEAMDRGLRDQLRRSAVSIMSNIAEGFALGTDRQFLRHLDIARGSAAELESLLVLVGDLFPGAADVGGVRDRLDATIGLIAKLSAYLRGERTGESPESYADQDVPYSPPTVHPRTSGLPDFRTSGLLP